MKVVKLLALVPAILVAACSDSGRVSFSVTSRSPGAPAPSAGFAAGSPISASLSAACSGTSLTDGTNTLCITSVELVVRKVELQRVEAASCDATPDNGDCEEFESGPVLVSVPLGADATALTATVAVKDVPKGMFNELEFEIHKLDATEAAALSLPAGISIRVKGTYNANPDFTFTSDLDVKEELALTQPLPVDGGAANVDLHVDLSSWFKNGTTLVDPASANKGQPNESIVANNIQRSFKAFEDDDHDGLDDSK